MAVLSFALEVCMGHATHWIQSAGALWRGHVPGQLVVQFTNACNARCPQCGMRVTSGSRRSTLATDAVKRIIDKAAARGFQAISFTGGEPFLYIDALVELIEHAGRAGIPYIRSGTNGYMFAHPERPDFDDRVRALADRLAATPLRNLWISIDSADAATHETMRGFEGVIEGMRRALPAFHERGLWPAANLGITRFAGGRPPWSREPGRLASECREGIARFFEQVADLGFTMANLCYPMSCEDAAASETIDAVYAATSTEDLVRFTPAEKVRLFDALLDVVPRYRHRLRIFTPLSSLYALGRQHNGARTAVYPCRGGIDYFFVDARDGQFYPCGYRGREPLGRLDERTAAPQPVEDAPHCTACDWECFRDPSQLFGPFLDLARRPLSAARRLVGDRPALWLWLEDLRYYRACGLFDGRRPPDMAALEHYGTAYRRA